MRKFLGTALVLVVIIGAVGLFRGWFQITTNSESERTKIEMTIDREKLKQDTDRLKGSVQEFSDKVNSNTDDAPIGNSGNR